MKMCRKCLVNKNTEEFHKNSQVKDGIAAYCKLCKSKIDKDWIKNKPKEIEKRKLRSRQWQKDNPEKYRESLKRWVTENPQQKWNLDKKSHLWTHYRMTIDDFSIMHESQDGKCNICKTVRKLVVDHDHSCCPTKITCGGCIRALVCSRCNTLLGMSDDSPQLLASAIEYLRSHHREDA
jgi:hypothetical protein